MTWLELKQYITDLGFEEDMTTEAEYNRIVINATNRAIDILRYKTAPRLEGYLKLIGYGEEVTDTDGFRHWELPTLEHIHIETDDLHDIGLPKMFNPLLELLTAHYVWLDDDESKAITYWNEYAQLEQELITTYTAFPKRSRIEGGF